MVGSITNIIKRELSAYFNSPVAYVFIIVFLLVSCALFMTSFFLAGACSMRAFFSSLPLIMVIFIPALTMRLWSEERKSGTIALLFSLPAGPWSLTLGKFFAALLFSLAALAGTAIIPVMLEFLGDPDWGPILGGYLGTLFLIMALLALGMATSALFQEQIVAFILALVLGFSAYMAGSGAIASLLDGWLPGAGSFLREALGISRHFASFEKGVVDLGDLLFFLSFTLILLLINVMTLEGRLRFRHSRAFLPTVALLILASVMFNAVVSGLRLPRFDLTEGGLYSISPAASKVLEKLEVPVTVTYYVSSREKLPTAMKEMARDVTDVLQELARLSPNLKYRVVDPASLEDGVEFLRKKGILPFNAQTIEQDSLDVKRVYSALSLSYLDKKEEVIPRLLPQDIGNLEYLVISKVFRLARSRSPKVILVAPKREVPPQLAMMYQQMGQPAPEQDDYGQLSQLHESEGYQVVRQQIDRNHQIPADADLLLLLEPSRLSPRQRHEIFSFLRRGGSAIVASQPYTYSYQEGQGGVVLWVKKSDHNINDLIGPLGVEVSDRLLMDQRHVTLAVTTQRGMGPFTALVQTPVNFPVQIQVLRDQMNQDLSLVNNCEALLYLWGSSLVLDEKKAQGLVVSPLFFSSPGSWQVEYHPGPLSNTELAASGHQGPFPLAVLISGVVPDPFNGKVPPWPGEDDNSTQEGKRSGDEEDQEAPARVVVIGDARMFSDQVLTAFNNAEFILNTVDALALGDELIHIRGKNKSQRFIANVSPGAKLFWRLTSVFLLPAMWCLWGVVHAVRRRKRRLRCE